MILGIYKKRNPVETNFKEIIEDFSLQGKRKVNTKEKNKLLLSVVKTEGEISEIIENENLIFAFSGEIHDFNGQNRKFQNKNEKAMLFLKLYKKFGESFLKEVNGIFSFVIYFKNRDKLVIGNDTFGLYPVFVYNDSDYLIFSSEYEPIVKHRNFNKELNHNAIFEYLLIGSVLGDKTFFKHINNLSIGSLLTISNNKFQTTQYDPVFTKNEEQKDEYYFAQQIANVFYKAVQNRIKNNPTEIFHLSGGVDSRLILANLTKEQKKTIDVRTKKFEHLEENEDEDILIAKDLAKKFNLNYSIQLATSEDKNISFFESNRLYYPRKTKFLEGLYGGELLGNRVVHKPFFENTCEKKLEQGKLIFKTNFLNKLKKFNIPKKDMLFAVNVLTRSFFSLHQINVWLTSYRLNISVDSPFLDKFFLKTLISTPIKYLNGEYLYNILFKIHYPDLTQIPTNSTVAHRKDSCIPLMKKGKNFKYSGNQKNQMIDHKIIEKYSEIINKNVFYSLPKNEQNSILKRMGMFYDWHKYFLKGNLLF